MSCIVAALKSNNTLIKLLVKENRFHVTLSASAINAIADNLSLTHLKVASTVYQLGDDRKVDIESFLYRNKWIKIYSTYYLLLAILHKNEIYFPRELIQIILSLSFGSEPPGFSADQLIKSIENIKKRNPSLIAKPLPQRLNPIKDLDLTINNEADLSFSIHNLRTNQFERLCLNSNNSACTANSWRVAASFAWFRRKS